MSDLATRVPGPLRRLALPAALLVHLVVLYAPRAPSAAGVPGVDKAVHVAVFAVVVLAAAAGGLPRLPVVAALVVHAPVSEVVQHRLLADRSGDPLDVVADLLGVVLGSLLARARRPGMMKR